MAAKLMQDKNYSKQVNEKMLAEYQRDKTNIELRNKIVEYNLRLVPFALKRNGGFIADFHDYDELIQEGYLKLIRAVELYEPGSGNFSSYALASLKGFGNKKISYNTEISLNSPISQEDEELELMDTIEDEEANFENKLVDENYYNHIRKQLKANLTNEQFEVIKHLYGLGVEQKTVKQAAETLNKTSKEIIAIKNKAFREIRNTKYFKEYYRENYLSLDFYISNSYFTNTSISKTNIINKPVEAAIIKMMDLENRIINEMIEKERLAAWSKNK